jgi:predicted 2-oxoglutarate/Fe(II)-dependent dioxygenase YbiX
LSAVTPGLAQLAPGIFVGRAFGPGEAAIVRRIADETAGWTPAVINAGGTVDRAVRDAEVLHADANPRLVGMCHQRLIAVTGEYAASVAPESVLGEMQFVRYRPGGGYVDHCDSPSREATSRVLSIVCYLNDDVAGGETVFAHGNVRVRPSAGLVVAFSPLLLHRAEPVAAGTKFAITAWYHARP